MNNNGHIQRCNFSVSSYQPRPHPPLELSDFINPGSEKANQSLLIHRHHEWQNNRRFEDSYKTVMCQNWLERAQCNFGKNCRFAHGFGDLRPATRPLPINEKYKTRPCEKYTNRGICPYGDRCLFIHPERENVAGILPPPPASPRPSRHQQQPPMPLTHSPICFPPPVHSSFAYSLPAFFRESFANANQRQADPSLPNNKERRNLFPQIFEELQREKENIMPIGDEDGEQQEKGTGGVRFSPLKKWSDQAEQQPPPIQRFFSPWTTDSGLPPDTKGSSLFASTSSHAFASSSSSHVFGGTMPPPVTPLSTHRNRKKWSDPDPYDTEMAQIVDKLVASPMFTRNELGK